jgi:hypothetical protein
VRILLHADALRELREARAWYTEHAAKEYGERLLEQVDASLDAIAAAPASFPRDARRAWARRARIARWPYTLVFTEYDGAIVVLALAHVRRRPGYWAKRRPR